MKKGNYIINTRNEKIAQIIEMTDSEIKIRYEEDGSEKTIKPATLKRWFKETEAPSKSLEDAIEGHAPKNGGTIFEMNVKGRKSLKIDGHMYAAIRYSKKGAELWLRSKAIPEDYKADLDYTTTNHTFDFRIKFNELSAENEEIIRNLLDYSISYQIEKKASTKGARRATEKGAA